jgi:rSAM/selenodomain-associated transferase 1
MGAADRLALFAREPVLGSVKSRLAASIGDTAALQAHRTLVEDALARLADGVGWHLELWVAGDPEHPDVVRWCSRYRVHARAQVGDNLGDRMRLTLTDMLHRGSKAVLMGCDCPTIDAGYVAAAFAALDRSDLVLGPAADGGYGLIGVRREVPDVFSNVRWGRADVLAATLARAAALDVETTLLEEVWDVDDLTGWKRYQALR